MSQLSDLGLIDWGMRIILGFTFWKGPHFLLNRVPVSIILKDVPASYGFLHIFCHKNSPVSWLTSLSWQVFPVSQRRLICWTTDPHPMHAPHGSMLHWSRPSPHSLLCPFSTLSNTHTVHLVFKKRNVTLFRSTHFKEQVEWHLAPSYWRQPPTSI